ncbi:radical SAM protein [Candidatus Woesearchaeota archaeon]|nr:MAG: radical SAM protein [Candidatus Woesearchaeota archaeon]
MEAYISDIAAEGGVLTVSFSGCDFNCPSCNTPQLAEFQTGEQQDLRIVQASIADAAPTQIVFTGGEPLLQRQALLALLRWCREHTNARLIIDTNASKPAVIEELITEQLVDEFLIDVKAPRDAFDRATHAGTFFIPAEQVFAEFLRSLAILRDAQNRVTLSFTTLIVPGLLYTKEDVLAIAALLDGFDAEWTLKPFIGGVTLDRRLRGLHSPSEHFLDNLARAVRAAYPNLRIRVQSTADTVV